MASKIKVDAIETTTGSGSIAINNTLSGFTSTGIDDNATSTAITIDSSENVGIGVVPATDWWSSTKAMQLSTRAAWYQDSGGTVVLSNNLKDDGTGSYLVTDEAAKYTLSANGKHYFSVASSGSADSAITWTNALEITNDGRGLSQFTAKAWAYFEWDASLQTGHNVSSITDMGAGHYRVDYTNSLSSSNVATTVSAEAGTNFLGISARATTSITVRNQTGGSWTDIAGSVTVFG